MKNIEFEILVKISILGSPEIKKFYFLQNACLQVAPERKPTTLI